MHAPGIPHLQVVPHLLRYLNTLLGQSLLFPSAGASSLNLTAFADADETSAQTLDAQ